MQLITHCAHCKRLISDKEVPGRSDEPQFSTGICEDCYQVHFGYLDESRALASVLQEDPYR